MTGWQFLAAYFGIGFVVLVAIFAIIGPKEAWEMLTYSDPDERPFAFTKTTTAEKARRDDDHFAMCLLVFFSLFLWPLFLAVAALYGIVLLVVWLAKGLATCITRSTN